MQGHRLRCPPTTKARPEVAARRRLHVFEPMNPSRVSEARKFCREQICHCGGLHLLTQHDESRTFSGIQAGAGIMNWRAPCYE